MKNILFLLCALLAVCAFGATAADPLPSWNDGTSKSAIVEFVARVTRPGSGDFVPTEGRIAVFDNDGTLWAEQLLYFHGLFVLDRIRALAPQHPQWEATNRTSPPSKATSRAWRQPATKAWSS